MFTAANIATVFSATYLLAQTAIVYAGIGNNNPFPLDTWPAKTFGQRSAAAMRAELVAAWIALAILLTRGGISVIWE